MQQRTKAFLRYAVICVVAYAIWRSLLPIAWAAQTVEEVMAQIARTHNAQQAADDMTVSSRATANGRRVTFTNVLRVKKGLTPAELASFQAAVQAEVVPQTCSVNREVLSWKKGISYAFVYQNTYGEQLANFVVDERVCGVR